MLNKLSKFDKAIDKLVVGIGDDYDKTVSNTHRTLPQSEQ